jgi:hypothetical protein
VTGSQLDGMYLCGDMSVVSQVCFNSYDVVNLWHARLGHPTEAVLKVLKDSLKLKVYNSPFACEVCHMAKQHMEPFPLSDHKSRVLGELIHLDVWGPNKKQSKEGFKYFLTIVDDYSRAVCVYLLKHKDKVFFNSQNFCAMIKNQFDKNIKKFRSDNRTEFVNKV